jgi:hypothetical protein
VEQFNLQRLLTEPILGYLSSLLTLYCFITIQYQKYSINNHIYNIVNQRYNLFDFNKKYQHLIFSKMFYFILYLCALEIAPIFLCFYV